MALLTRGMLVAVCVPTPDGGARSRLGVRFVGANAFRGGDI